MIKLNEDDVPVAILTHQELKSKVFGYPIISDSDSVSQFIDEVENMSDVDNSN